MGFQGMAVYFSLNNAVIYRKPRLGGAAGLCGQPDDGGHMAGLAIPATKEAETPTAIDERLATYSASQMMEAIRPVWPSLR